jgi:hypothetical protein
LHAVWPLLIAACSSYSPSGLAPGTSAAQAQQSMGKPTGSYELPGGGRRLEFARGPVGIHTFMLDFDAQDRLVRWEQVLTEQHFLELHAGMTKEEVLQRVGHPGNASYFPRQQQNVWSYRYENSFCLVLEIDLDRNERVTSVGHGMDPLCRDANDGGM